MAAPAIGRLSYAGPIRSPTTDRRRRLHRIVRLLSPTEPGAAAAALAILAIGGCGGRSTTTTTTSTPRGTAAGVGAAVAGSNALAVELLRGLDPADANSVFSPYSIQAALTMADLGAAGRTARQLNRVLHTSDAARLADSGATLANRLAADTRARGAGTETGTGTGTGTGTETGTETGTAAPSAPTLSVANSVWVQSGFRLNSTFTRALARDFASHSRTLDFRRQPDRSRRTINQWVADHTAGRIRDLMPAGSITPLTRLALANAVYLKAHWATPFSPRATGPGPFFGPAGRVRAEFMALTTELRYGRTRGYQALALPYARSRLSMLVVMPPRGALDGFQRRLTPATLGAIGRSLQPRRIALRMPKFHVLVRTDLVPALTALGMPVAFSDHADFSGITADVPLKISAVQHAADLRVDEQGTIAAAATGISIGATSAVPQPALNVSIDHPFLLFLRDDATGVILFAGRITDPAQH